MFLGETLEEIQEELVKKDKVRQEIQTTMRKVTRLSKQAIFLVHKAMLKEAKEILTKAGRILANVRGLSGRYPDLFYMGTVDSGFQEYTEASILLSLVQEGCFVSFKEINVPKASYVLGLADVVGELRRRALNFLRKGKAQEAEKCLELFGSWTQKKMRHC
jgi:translin